MKPSTSLSLVAGLLLGLLMSLSPAAEAARNTAGTYSLPAGNPVVSGTTITSTWANTTLGDIKTELTNSLSRDGYGAMRAPLKVPSGSSAAPTLTFSSDSASGLYLNGASDVRMSVASTDLMKWTASGPEALAALTCSKGATVTTSTTNGAGLTSTGNGTGDGVVRTGGATGDGVVRTGGATGDGATFSGGATSGAAWWPPAPGALRRWWPPEAGRTPRARSSPLRATRQVSPPPEDPLPELGFLRLEGLLPELA